MTDNPDKLRAFAERSAEVVQALANLNALWYEAEDAAPDREAFIASISDGYPFGESLEEVVARAVDWNNKVADVAARPPGVVVHAADLMAEHVADLRAEMARPGQRQQHAVDASDETHERGMRNALGGVYGDFAACLTPGLVLNLVDLLRAVGDDDDCADIGAARASARQLAGRYRAAYARNDERRRRH